jgi:glycosyltransferase involved in cell wall biosynthesis
MPIMRDYRVKLFEWINARYDCTFVFTTIAPGVCLPREMRTYVIGSCGKVSECFTVANLCATLDYDVVLMHAEAESSVLAWIIARLRRKKTILWGEHWKFPDLAVGRWLFELLRGRATGLKRAIKGAIMRRLFANADAFVAIGDRAFQHYSAYVKKSRITCAKKYVEKYPKALATPRAHEFVARHSWSRIVLFAGRLVPIKGVRYLIEAFAEVESSFPEAVLLIVGDGDQREELQRLADRHKIRNIVFWGWGSREELELFYSRCYVFVQPSVEIDYRYEVNGYIVYECMNYAKPIVTTDAVGAAPQFVRDGFNGYVVPNGDVAALGKALARLLTNEEVAMTMGLRSKWIYDSEISLPGNIEAFSSAIASLQRS